MSSQIKSIIACATIVLFCYAIMLSFSIMKSIKEPLIPKTSTTLTELQTTITQYKKLTTTLNETILDTLPLTKVPSPFGVIRAPRRVQPTIPKETFERVPLRLTGIMAGDKRIVLLKERNGTPHMLSKGETIHNRKIIKITSTSVILEDKLGKDTLTVE